MEQHIERPNLTWHYFDDNSQEAIAFLHKNFSFHPLDFEDVEAGPQQPKVDFYSDYLFGIFHFPAEQNGDSIHVFEVDIFMSENYLITVSKGENNVLKRIFQKAKKDKTYQEEIMGKDGAFLLYKLLDALTDDCWPRVRKISGQINDIEEEIYSEKMQKTTLQKIAFVKRNLIRLKRIIYPQQLAISLLVRTNDLSYLPPALNIYYDDINDTLQRLQMITESHVDVMNSLHNVNESLISQRTNEVIKLLTVISVSLLPMTILTGLYGMNVEGLPFVDHPNSIWLLFGGVLLAIACIMIYFRRRGWL